MTATPPSTHPGQTDGTGAGRRTPVVNRLLGWLLRSPRPIAFIRRHPLASYYALAMALSWAYWIPLARSGGDGSHVPGLAGPAIAGVLLTAVVEGAPGVRDLARRVTRWAVAARW